MGHDIFDLCCTSNCSIHADCIFIPAASLGPHNPTIYAFMELSFDALRFLLTLVHLFLGTYSRGRWGLRLWHNLAQNGALYFGWVCLILCSLNADPLTTVLLFSVIFSVNLTWGIMIRYASPGIRGALAAWVQVISISDKRTNTCFSSPCAM